MWAICFSRIASLIKGVKQYENAHVFLWLTKLQGQEMWKARAGRGALGRTSKLDPEVRSFAPMTVIFGLFRAYVTFKIPAPAARSYVFFVWHCLRCPAPPALPWGQGRVRGREEDRQGGVSFLPSLPSNESRAARAATRTRRSSRLILPHPFLPLHWTHANPHTPTQCG